MKIAVAGQAAPGRIAHFGHAVSFEIFDIDVEPPRLLQTRQVTPHCVGNRGDGWRLTQSVELLSDCVAVLARRIGPCARDALRQHDIIPVEHSGDLTGAGAASTLAAIRLAAGRSLAAQHMEG